MALRLIEIYIKADYQQQVLDTLKESGTVQVLQLESAGDAEVHIKMLMKVEHTEGVLDELEKKFLSVQGFRALLYNVEASIPRLEEEPESTANEAKKKAVRFGRISRAELYTDIEQAGKMSFAFVMMLALSSIVATVGLIRDNAAVVIGAMVIAPLLGPNVAMALAATLGDAELFRRARITLVWGLSLPLIVAALIGWLFPIHCDTTEILSRTEVSLLDLVLALSAGCAATLSFTLSTASALIGVMVAVALMPPLVTCGLLLGCGAWAQALGAGLLLGANLICVNLAGVLTFLLQGIQPLRWWDKSQARLMTRRALVVWIILLVVLLAALWLSARRQGG